MICVSCNKDKPINDFTWKNKAQGVHHRFCRDCQRIYQGKWYKSHREEHIARTANRRQIWKKEARDYVYEYLKSRPCSCGFSNPVALEFHHRDPTNKKMEVAKMIQGGWPFGMVKEEIAKCDVMCANCHRIKTAKEQGWYKAI